jgi:PAS domain S-box-containing protein
MADQRITESLIGRRMRRASGPLLTLIVVGIIEAFPLGFMPALPLVLTLTIAYSVLAGGLGPGLVSSALAIAFASYYYRTPGSPFRYSTSNLERLAIFVLATPLVVATLVKLKQRLDEVLVRERSLRREAESERTKVAAIIESITDGFFALDRQWRYTYVNRQAEQLVGRKGGELLGKVVWEAFPPLVGSMWDCEYHRAIEQRVPVHFEEFYPPLDTWFETHAYPSEEGITIYIRSINDRKRTEQALRARELQQAEIAKLGQAALLGSDIPSLMNTAVRMLATTLESEFVKVLEMVPGETELLLRAGIGWKEGVEHRVAARERSQAGYTLASRQPVIVEDLATEKRFQGPPLLLDHGVRSGMSVIIPGHQQPFGILGVHSRSKRVYSADDVNFLQAVANVLAGAIERKRGEGTLAESELRFRQIAENVREVFYITAIDPARVLYVNPSYEAVWGRSLASLYERPSSWLEAIHPDDRPYVERHLAGRDSGFFDGEYRLVRPDGAVRWIRDRSSPVLDASGRAYRLVGIAEDVTELKEAAQAAGRLAVSEASVRARDEVLAIVAHDLRSPLHTISMAADLLGQSELPEEKRAHQAKIVRRAVKSAEQLIRDLLDVARIETGQLVMEPEPVDVRSLVSEACEAFQLPASEKAVALGCDVPENVPPVLGDRERILQALANLLGNALKFTPRQGQVTIRARQCPEGIDFSVQDTGPGIASDALPHVFDRFWRARSADRKGLGLGLAIVKGIVTAHHGRVWAESEPGKGSTFHCTIPSIRA